MWSLFRESDGRATSQTVVVTMKEKERGGGRKDGEKEGGRERGRNGKSCDFLKATLKVLKETRHTTSA